MRGQARQREGWKVKLLVKMSTLRPWTLRKSAPYFQPSLKKGKPQSVVQIQRKQHKAKLTFQEVQINLSGPRVCPVCRDDSPWCTRRRWQRQYVKKSLIRNSSWSLVRTQGTRPRHSSGKEIPAGVTVTLWLVFWTVHGHFPSPGGGAVGEVGRDKVTIFLRGDLGLGRWVWDKQYLRLTEDTVLTLFLPISFLLLLLAYYGCTGGHCDMYMCAYNICPSFSLIHPPWMFRTISASFIF